MNKLFYLPALLIGRRIMILPNSNDVSHISKFILLTVILLVIFPEKVFEAEYQVTYEIEQVVLCDSLKVDVTWYTSSVYETDSTPFITAEYIPIYFFIL